MRMQFGLTAFQRARGDLPELPVQNMFAEKAQTEETGIVLQSRPGLDTITDLGTTVQAIFQKDGVLSGSEFTVVDGDLYKDRVLVGAIDGTGPFFLDGYEDELFIAGGGSLWKYDGATLSAIAFPDSADVLKCVVGASRLVAIRKDTEKYYFSPALGDTIDGLDLISAESQPDRLKDVLFLDDMLVLFGSETVEFHPNTTDPDAPFQPLEGRVFECGIKATGAASAIGSTFAWVTHDNRVCLESPEQVLSNEGLETKIKASTECRLWTFYIDGTEFLALTLDDSTWVMPLRSQTWHEFTSYGYDNWLPRCYANGVFGCADGRLAEWGTGHLDFTGELTRLFRAGFPLNSGTVPVNNIILRTNPGTTPYLDGDFAEPVVEVRLSRDKGKTWGSWKPSSLGRQGDYAKRVQWAGLGMAFQPGLLAEFRVTAPVPFRVSDVLINEQFGQ